MSDRAGRITMVDIDRLAAEIAFYARAFDKEQDIEGDAEFNEEIFTWDDLGLLIAKRAALPAR